MSRRFHFDGTSISPRFHFDFTSASLSIHFAYSRKKGETPCRTRARGRLGTTKGKRRRQARTKQNDYLFGLTPPTSDISRHSAGPETSKNDSKPLSIELFVLGISAMANVLYVDFVGFLRRPRRIGKDHDTTRHRKPAKLFWESASSPAN